MTPPLASPNRLVYQSQILSANRSLLWALFGALGLLIGLFAAEILNGPAPIASTVFVFPLTPTMDDPLMTPKANPEIAALVTAVEGLKSPTPSPFASPQVAFTSTPTTIYCTLTPNPGVRCDASTWPVTPSVTATPTSPVICDVAIQTPNAYLNMPGTECTWATSTPTRAAKGVLDPWSGTTGPSS